MNFVKVLFIYFFREGKGGRKRGREALCVASHKPPTPPTEDLARNPGMCPRLGIEPATL